MDLSINKTKSPKTNINAALNQSTNSNKRLHFLSFYQNQLILTNPKKIYELDIEMQNYPSFYQVTYYYII